MGRTPNFPMPPEATIFKLRKANFVRCDSPIVLKFRKATFIGTEVLNLWKDYWKNRGLTRKIPNFLGLFGK